MKKEFETLLDQYLELPARLDEVLEGLDEEDFDLRPEGEWSIREYVAHLVEGEQLWQINLRVILGLNGTEFPMSWYPEHTQVEWSELWAYNKRSIEVLLDQYHANTQYLVDILENLSENVWEHYGHITWPGTEKESLYSVREIVKMQISHLDGHVEDIRAIRALHGR
jgi:hypothetical protein